MRPLVVSLTLRWFAVGGGMVAYAVALVGGFWLVPVACATTGMWVLHALMAACLLVAGASLGVAWLLWRGAPDPDPPPPRRAGRLADRVHLLGLIGGSVRLALTGLLWSTASTDPPPPPSPDRPRREREQAMALVGIVLGVLSVLLVAFHWAPVFVLDPCR